MKTKTKKAKQNKLKQELMARIQNAHGGLDSLLQTNTLKISKCKMLKTSQKKEYVISTDRTQFQLMKDLRNKFGV